MRPEALTFLAQADEITRLLDDPAGMPAGPDSEVWYGWARACRRHWIRLAELADTEGLDSQAFAAELGALGDLHEVLSAWLAMRGGAR